MLLLFVFAFLSGLITIFAPCIWPLLPIVLSATTSGGHKKPLGITLGIIASFAFFTLTLSYIVKIIPFDPNILRFFAVLVIGILGLSLIIPKFSAALEGWVSALSSKITPKTNTQNSSGFLSGLVTGFSLGIVWSPCAGPILATIATLAATQTVNFQIVLVTIFYCLGIGIPLFIFATLGRSIFTKSRLLSPYTGRIQQVFGVIMILTAFLIFTGYDRVLQTNLLNSIPAYSNFLYQLEGNKTIQSELDKIKGNKNNHITSSTFTPTDMGENKGLPNLGQAPDFVGIVKWLNTDKPLNMQDLRGKVVLIDFWTYTCINCIRTLPHITSWYDKYKDYGFVVVGIHTPEFEFEKNSDNVLNAIKQYNIHYPVPQDNNYSTWNTYNNHYWPAEYLVDVNGNVRKVHFGEGEYDQMEMAIQDLLIEAGKSPNVPLIDMQDETPKSPLTEETYLGLNRRTGFKDYWDLGGDWDIKDEYIESKTNSSLDLKFNAAKVFLVITPATSKDIIKVSVDGKLTQTITATEAKLYSLVELPQVGNHQLHLDFQTPGTKAYAFTFGD